MNRERGLQIVLGVVGLAFSFMIYPVAMILWHREASGYTDAMMGSIYVVLGVFLLAALPNPFAHRSLVLFAGWSSLVHAAVMAVMILRDPGARELLPGVAIFAAAGIPLVLLAPRRNEISQSSAAGA